MISFILACSKSNIIAKLLHLNRNSCGQLGSFKSPENNILRVELKANGTTQDFRRLMDHNETKL